MRETPRGHISYYEAGTASKRREEKNPYESESKNELRIIVRRKADPRGSGK